MTENEINITDMIKALQCIASQDADGDCYCDHFNAHLTCEQFGDNARLDEKHMSCGGISKNTQSCPYSQKTYGVCYEDGELWWLKDIVSILEEIQQYRAIGTVEELKSMKENGAFTGVELAQLAAMQMRLKEYSAIGTIEEFKDLKENQRKCEDCAGCTNWKCDCANIREQAITEFYDKVLNFEDYIEPKGTSEFGAVLLYSGKDITNMIVKIAEEMRGAE